MSLRKKEAVALFRSGYNCAQAVTTVFAKELKLDKESILALTSGFGGGMGKMQETCGAVSGAFMLFGVYAGRNTDNNRDAKMKANELVKLFTDRFSQERGSICCRELLGYDMNTDEGREEIQKKNLFATVCEDCIELSVGIIEDVLE